MRLTQAQRSTSFLASTRITRRPQATKTWQMVLQLVRLIVIHKDILRYYYSDLFHPSKDYLGVL